MTETNRELVRVDPAKCTGQGRCYTLAEAFFEPDDEGFSVVLEPEVDADHPAIADLRAAMDNCPERAITVRGAE